MTVLDRAVEASQEAALKALGKQFVRSEETPDLTAYCDRLLALGFNDEMGIKFMLTGWAILREQREQPAESLGSRAAVHDEPASDKQTAYLAKLADEKGFTAPHMAGMTKARASELIDKLQAGRYDPETDDVPF